MPAQTRQNELVFESSVVKLTSVSLLYFNAGNSTVTASAATALEQVISISSFSAYCFIYRTFRCADKFNDVASLHLITTLVL